MDIDTASETCSKVLDAIPKVIIADRALLGTALTGILARGHVLLEDVPGAGRTLTAQSITTALGLSFPRMQFISDLPPADMTGTNVYDERKRTFGFSPGPIFANIVFADEINRAPPKTQVALLETMEEGQVTVDGETHQPPDPFFVITTQNPVGQKGTSTLPEAQVDRFVVKSAIGYPDLGSEVEPLHRRADRSDQSPSVECVLDHGAVTTIHCTPESVRVEDDLLEYMTKLAREARTNHRIRIGVSLRGTQRLFEAIHTRTVIEGREFAMSDDVKRVTQSVLAHRLVLTSNTRVEDVRKSDVIDDVLGRVTVPTPE